MFAELPSPQTDRSQISDGFHTFAELYEHRHALFLALANSGLLHRAWRSKLHDDGTMHDGYFIAGIDLPTGTVSYHLPCLTGTPSAVHPDPGPRPAWDGHTPEDVIERLLAWAACEV